MDSTDSYSATINASVALKLAHIAENAASNTICGPVYGFDDLEEKLINISHAINFPTFNNNSNNNNNDDFFSLRQSNVAFQVDFLKTLRATKSAVKLLGWFVCASNGQFISPNVVNSLQQLQRVIIEEQRSDLPAILVVFDPAKSQNGLLSLKVYKLTEAFIKTSNAEHKFVAKNLIENKLSYKNILEELSTEIKNNHLTNLKINDLDGSILPSEGDNLRLASNNKEFIKQCTDQLFQAVDHFNYNLGSMNYFQKNLNREITNINNWQAKMDVQNQEKLQANPKAKIEKADWRKEFSLPTPLSKFDNLVTSSIISNLCNNIEASENVELVKAAGVQSSLGL